jgi:hypothetical protein
METFLITNLLVGMDTDLNATAARLSRIYLCVKSQMICLDKIPPSALDELREQLKELLELIEGRAGAMQQGALASNP